MLTKLLFIILLSGGLFAEKAEVKAEHSQALVCRAPSLGLIGRSQVDKATQSLAKDLKLVKNKRKDSRQLFLYKKSVSSSRFLNQSLVSETPAGDLSLLEDLFAEL